MLFSGCFNRGQRIGNFDFCACSVHAATIAIVHEYAYGYVAMKQEIIPRNQQED